MGAGRRPGRRIGGPARPERASRGSSPAPRPPAGTARRRCCARSRSGRSGPSGGSTSSSAASAAAAGRLDADAGGRERAHRPRDRPLRDLHERRAEPDQLRPRASGTATRTARPSAKVSQASHSTGRPAATLSAITGAPFDTTPSAPSPPSPRATPISSAPLPTGTTVSAGALAQLLDDLAADRGVALELRRLGAVLEEGQPAPARRGRAPRPWPRPRRRRRGAPRRPAARADRASRGWPARARTPPRAARCAAPPTRWPRRDCRWRRSRPRSRPASR